MTRKTESWTRVIFCLFNLNWWDGWCKLA